jgi:hypothetical protein
VSAERNADSRYHTAARRFERWLVDRRYETAYLDDHSFRNPQSLEEFFRELPYPLGKNDIVSRAMSAGFDQRTVAALASLPDREYLSANELGNSA